MAKRDKIYWVITICQAPYLHYYLNLADERDSNLSQSACWLGAAARTKTLVWLEGTSCPASDKLPGWAKSSSPGRVLPQTLRSAWPSNVAAWRSSGYWTMTNEERDFQAGSPKRGFPFPAQGRWARVEPVCWWQWSHRTEGARRHCACFGLRWARNKTQIILIHWDLSVWAVELYATLSPETQTFTGDKPGTVLTLYVSSIESVVQTDTYREKLHVQKSNSTRSWRDHGSTSF